MQSTGFYLKVHPKAGSEVLAPYRVDLAIKDDFKFAKIMAKSTFDGLTEIGHLVLGVSVWHDNEIDCYDVYVGRERWAHSKTPAPAPAQEKPEHPFPVDSILVEQWGWSMTLYAFYKVVGYTKSGKSVRLVELNDIRNRLPNGSFLATPGSKQEGTPFTKRLKTDHNGDAAVIGKYDGYARPYNPNREYVGNDYD